MAPRIALISALKLSIAPVGDSFERLWPDATRINLLDDSLSVDRQSDGVLTEAMVQRFLELGRYAVRQARADAVLFTCSAFGEAIDAVARDLDVPVLKPNEAMIAEAVALACPIGLLATFGPTLDSMVREFPQGMPVEPRLAPGALAAAEAGDFEAHDRLAATAATGFRAPGAIALAQFSLARAAPVIEAATGLQVLTTPDCAVRALRQRLDA